MKILHITRQFYPGIGGIESVVQNLCKSLIQKGHKCGVVSLNRSFDSPGSRYPKFGKVDGISIYRIPFLGYRRLFFAPNILDFLNNYDILHIHGIDFFVDFLVLTKIIHNRPIVVSTHGGFFHTPFLLPVKKLYFSTITKTILKRVNQVICVSRHDVRLFSKVCNKLRLIENGVEMSRLLKVEKKIRKGLLVYFGRIDEHKGLRELIEAIAMVIHKGSSIKLEIVGPDPHNFTSTLLKLVEEKGVQDSVRFRGEVEYDELVHLLKKAHFFISASKYEGFGLTLIEAMASGTVPILNDIDSFRDFIDEEVNGFITAFSKPEVASRCIYSLLHVSLEKIVQMGVKARQKAKDYSWENKVLQFIEVYKSIVQK